ncbi:MAG: prolyl-tRNA synthetase associated domain-containing protein [Candidatus Aminicenantes bacterium]|nr:prolyl-tRNA synthetase associated domain-containing protein [Candidatus Aminicenantes bacterium]
MKEDKEKKVIEALEKLNISYIRHAHPPVFTVEQAVEQWKGIEGAHCKNIFVRNKKGNRHFLIIVEHLKKLDLKNLSSRLGQDRLSFASPERLNKYLGLEAGSVSPFGLINDIDHHVTVLIDENLKQEEFINFHPNINTATYTLSFSDFIKFLKWINNKIDFLKI